LEYVSRERKREEGRKTEKQRGKDVVDRVEPVVEIYQQSLTKWGRLTHLGQWEQAEGPLQVGREEGRVPPAPDNHYPSRFSCLR
jgi:hypothetical protein